jgi:dihydrofolate synthase/folylpolyglutamate synthase
MNLEQITDLLFSRRPENDVEFKLDRIYEVLELLGNPQHNFKSVHIAGTNGKTSTSFMCAKILGLHGVKTGLFTSPHINNVTERIRVNLFPIDEQQFINAYHKVIKAVEEVESNPVNGKLGFFEVMTIMTFQIFSDEQVKIAVIEVGLGGLLDSTNVLSEEDVVVSVITPIGVDHVEYLGSTIHEIAYQKAGIIKNDVPVVVAQQSEEAIKVIEAVAEKRNAKIHLPDDSIVDALDNGVFIPYYLKMNLSTAITASMVALESQDKVFTISADLISNIGSITYVPGRFEGYERKDGKYLFFDVSHNPHGANMLKETFQKWAGGEPAKKKLNTVALVAQFSDKDTYGFMKVLSEFVDGVIVTRNSSPRSRTPEEMQNIAQNFFDTDEIAVYDDLSSAFENSLKSADILLVTGSVVTVSDAKELPPPPSS